MPDMQTTFQPKITDFMFAEILLWKSKFSKWKSSLILFDCIYIYIVYYCYHLNCYIVIYDSHAVLYLSEPMCYISILIVWPNCSQYMIGGNINVTSNFNIFIFCHYACPMWINEIKNDYVINMLVNVLVCTCSIWAGKLH